jgi:hypothetical protein
MIPGIYLLSQIIQLLYISMTLLAAAVIAGAIVVGFGTMQLQVSALLERYSRLITILLAFAAMAFIAVALINRKPSARFPKPNTVFYLYNSDSSTAKWATWDLHPDEWTKQFISIDPFRIPVRHFSLLDQINPFNENVLLASEAPVSTVSIPEVILLSDLTSDTLRIVRFEIRSGPGTEIIIIDPEIPSLIKSVYLNGKYLDPGFRNTDEPWPLFWYGAGMSPLEMTLRVKPFHPVRLKITGIMNGLPPGLERTMKSRPEWMIPMPGYQDATMVTKSYLIAAPGSDF